MSGPPDAVARGNNADLFYSWSEGEAFTYYEHNRRDNLNCTRVTQREILSWDSARTLVQANATVRFMVDYGMVCRLCLQESYHKSWLHCQECRTVVCHLRCMKKYVQIAQHGTKCPGCNIGLIFADVPGEDPNKFVPCNMEPCKVKVNQGLPSPNPSLGQ